MNFNHLFLFVFISQASSVFSQEFIKQLALPVPDHIVIAILENHSYSQIIGSAAAPKINALANDSMSALFKRSYAIEHPSQPNYLDLYAGCNQGVTDNNIPAGIPFITPNLGRQLISSGKTFITYSEDLPSVGYNGAASGDYARKHNPVANWMGTGTNQVPVTCNQPFTAFPTNFSLLPTVCYIVPNQQNDMHNGSDPSRIMIGDSWVYNNLNAYIQWAKTNNSLFILTFDEDDNSENNRIVTIFTGPMVLAGQYSDTINHYNILRTIEDIYGLPYACNAATAAPITNCWLNTTGVNENKSDERSISVFPNPSNEKIILPHGKYESLKIYTMIGELVLTADPQQKFIDIRSLPNGMYFLKASGKENTATTKFIKE